MPSGVYVKTPEHRAKLAAAQRGRKVGPPSEKTRRKISEALKRSMKHFNRALEMQGKSRPKEVCEKISATRRKRGLGWITGDVNERLRVRLGPGWESEVYINTPGTGRGMTQFRVDLANWEEKIVIEIDGKSHMDTAQKERDRRRDLALTSAGWKVIRVPEKLIP